MDLSRRKLLQILGLAGPAYFLPSLRGRSAHAVDPTIPTRILFFYTPHGTLLRQWVRPPAGAAAATQTSWELGPVLQPLQTWKSQLLLIEGLEMVTADNDPVAASNAHVAGQTHALSAIGRVGAAAAGGISIDELIAQRLNSPTPVTSVPILEMSARYNQDIAPFLTSWTGSNALVPPMTDPSRVYSRLFPNGPPSTTTQSAAMVAAQRKKSILDAALAEFNAVQAPLSGADRAKLQSHADLIRALETQIGLGADVVTCSAPDQATATAGYRASCPSGAGNACVESATDAFISLAVAALACDVTRVITFDVDQLPDNEFGVDDVHAFLHGMDDVNLYANERWGSKLTAPSTATDPGGINTAVAFFNRYAQMFGKLIAGMAAVPESDGTTLLDHTILVWCGEIGSTGHVTRMMNYVIAGGGGARIGTGRYLSMPRTPNPSTSADAYPTIGLPHNNLFVSLANLMGLSNVTTFGDSRVCTGPLSGLTG